MRVTVGIAAALIFAITLFLFLATPQHAYAQVLQQVEKAQSMSCDLSMGNEVAHLLVRGNMMRFELEGGGVSIGDRATGKWVSIDPKARTAMTITMARQEFDLYAIFHDFQDGKEERLGDKQLNGKKVTGFRVTRHLSERGKEQETPLTIWVDTATNLPVEAEIAEKDQITHATNFKWDLPLDEKLFSMAIPEGYKVEDMGGIAADQLKAPPTTQEAAKLVLKAGVGIGDLKFGDDAARVTELFGKPESITSDIAWAYPSKGLWLTVSPKQGVLTIMAGSKKAYPMFNVNDFPGKLENGLGIGSPREEVERVYGKPERTDANGNDTTNLQYDKAYLWFTIQSGKVIQIYLNLSPAGRDAIRAKLAASQPAPPKSDLP